MKDIILTSREQYIYETIADVVAGKTKKKRAAIKLNFSPRHVNRLINKFNITGKAAFSHANKGKTPAIKLSEQLRQKIVKIYTEKFSDTNFTHFSEILLEDYNIKVSPPTINKLMRENNIVSPKARRKTKNDMRKLLKEKLNDKNSKKIHNEIIEKIDNIETNPHPRRPRSKYMGEMIQMDACSKKWLPSADTWHLHLAVDDATGEVVGAYFDTQETLNGYYNITKQIIDNYGIPALFYTDRRTVFEYQKKEHYLFDNDKTFTQFSYACHQLGIEIETTSIPQAKGRIERLNQTFESRLPADLRRAGVTTIEQANEFLKSYLKKYNDQFALQLNDSRSVFENQVDFENLNIILGVVAKRVIDTGHSIKFKNSYYLPYDEKGNRVTFKKGTKSLVIESFDKILYANIDEKFYLLEKIEEHERFSKNFDLEKETEKKKTKKPYIPPANHPWKLASYQKYLEKQEQKTG